MICKVCEKEYKPKGISTHIILHHNMSVQEYFDRYLKQPNDGICVTCGKPTKFKGIKFGYRKHCCNKCAQSDPEIKEKKAQTCIAKYGVDNAYKSDEIKSKIREIIKEKYGVDSVLKTDFVRQKTYESMRLDTTKDKIASSKLNRIHEFELENDCTLFTTLRRKYGQSWIHLPLERLVLNGHASFIKNSDIPKIIEYVETNAKSKIEVELIESIKEFYHKEISNLNRHVIGPKELDIYLPDLHLAIEINGIHWHSIERGTSKDYHLVKSLLCREKNIRLIHIYEFEDFDVQKQLLKDLILGCDNYPKNDFNKNNLIESIPKPEIVYNDGWHTIYGAGKLY